MMKVKELIQILEGLDPDAYVVNTGHSDEVGSYDDIYLEPIPKLMSIKAYKERNWRGRYYETDTFESGCYWAYCV